MTEKVSQERPEVTLVTRKQGKDSASGPTNCVPKCGPCKPIGCVPPAPRPPGPCPPKR